MNTKQITAAIVLFAAAGAAMAEAPYPPETKFVSTKTRAEVIAELKQAQAQHLIANDANYPIVIQARTPLSHDEVVSQSKQVSNNLYGGA
jgi:thiol:disulfide interchange protein